MRPDLDSTPCSHITRQAKSETRSTGLAPKPGALCDTQPTSQINVQNAIVYYSPSTVPCKAQLCISITRWSCAVERLLPTSMATSDFRRQSTLIRCDALPCWGLLHPVVVVSCERSARCNKCAYRHHSTDQLSVHPLAQQKVG